MTKIVACPACGKRNRLPVVASGTPRCAACHGNLPWLVDADEQTFAGAVATSLPVLVDLWAPWCGPCRIVAPGVERAAEQFAGRLKVVKVNVDDAPAVSTRFGVQGIPTLLILRDGRPVDRHVGALPAGPLLSWIGAAVERAA